jgi:uncharacterized membrane protein
MFIRVRDSHSRSIVKAVSWRVTGIVDTFVLSFIFTGSVKVAGSIAGSEAITKMILYYVPHCALRYDRLQLHENWPGRDRNALPSLPRSGIEICLR